MVYANRGRKKEEKEVTADIAVKIYRMVPARIRGYYPGFPTSTSHLYQKGGGWTMIRNLMGDSKVPRPDMP
jgi:hypothetical protein